MLRLGLGTETTWFRFWKRSCFDLKYLVLSPQTQLELLASLLVSTKVSSGVSLSNIKTQSPSGLLSPPPSDFYSSVHGFGFAGRAEFIRTYSMLVQICLNMIVVTVLLSGRLMEVGYFLQCNRQRENTSTGEGGSGPSWPLTRSQIDSKTHLCLCAWQQADLVYTQPLEA